MYIIIVLQIILKAFFVFIVVFSLGILLSSCQKRLSHFRWIIPPKQNVTLKLAFSSDEVGLFDQTLNFELVGTCKHYQLFCRGKCEVPTISKDPRSATEREQVVFLGCLYSLSYVQSGIPSSEEDSQERRTHAEDVRSGRTQVFLWSTALW